MLEYTFGDFECAKSLIKILNEDYIDDKFLRRKITNIINNFQKDCNDICKNLSDTRLKTKILNLIKHDCLSNVNKFYLHNNYIREDLYTHLENVIITIYRNKLKNEN